MHTQIHIYIYTYYWTLLLLFLPGWLCNWVLGMQPGTSSLCAGSPHYRSLIGISAAFCSGIVYAACGQCQYLARSSPQFQDKEPFVFMCLSMCMLLLCLCVCVCLCLYIECVDVCGHWTLMLARESWWKSTCASIEVFPRNWTIALCKHVNAIIIV